MSRIGNFPVELPTGVEVQFSPSEISVKGPLGTMIPELTSAPPTAAAIARHYGDLLAGIVVERGDEGDLAGMGVAVLAADTIMRSRADSLRLAREVLAFAGSIAP